MFHWIPSFLTRAWLNLKFFMPALLGILALVSLFRVFEYGRYAGEWLGEATVFCLSFNISICIILTIIDSLISPRFSKTRGSLQVIALGTSSFLDSLPKYVFLKRGGEAYPQLGTEIFAWFLCAAFLLFLKYSYEARQTLRQQETVMRQKEEAQRLTMKFRTLESEYLLSTMAEIEKKLEHSLANDDEQSREIAIDTMEKLAEHYQTLLLQEAKEESLRAKL